MDFQNLLTFLFGLALYYCLSRSLSKRSKNLPPGPNRLPIIGNLHLLGSKPHESLANLAKKHGPIMSLKLGQVTTIVFSSSAMAKEVLQKQDLAFSSRFIPDSTRALDHNKYSVIWLPVASSGWRNLRKILNYNIFSSSRLDANQHSRFKKIEELVEYCRRKSEIGESVEIGGAAFQTSLNMLSNTIFSIDSDQQFKEFISNIMVEGAKPNLGDLFPLLKYFDLQGIKSRMANHFGAALKIFDGLVDERLEQNKSQGVLKNDVLDVLLTTSQENPEDIDRIHIEHLCMNLFVAGTDATSTTLEWAMTELIKNPEIMEKAKNELTEVIGRGRIIKEADVPSLHYLQCIIKETLRLHPPVPVLVPRRVDQDVEVSGYTIPKGSQVLVNAWAIGRDPDVWEDPLTFKPERFFKSEIDVKGCNFELIPFGGGRRICPGLPLALRMLSVMLGSLLNSFNWKIEEGFELDQLDTEEKVGVVLQKAHPLKAIPISL